MDLGIKYVPVIMMLGLGFAIPMLLYVIASGAGPRQASERKMTPFECGMESVGDVRHRFTVKFFLVALLFIIFDIEAVFIYPWAVLFRELGLFGFIEMGVFILILLLGLVYVWKKGALEWD